MTTNIFTETQIYEVEKLELFFSDYLSVPRAERVNLYYNLLYQEISIKELELKYGS